jgi:hypothetical protein
MKTILKFVHVLSLLITSAICLPTFAVPNDGWKVADWILKDDINEVTDGSLDLCNVFCREANGKILLKVTTRSPLSVQSTIHIDLSDSKGYAIRLKSDAQEKNATWSLYRGVCEVTVVVPDSWSTLSQVLVQLVNANTGEIADEGSVDMRNRQSLDNDVGNCAFVHHGNQGLTYTNVFRGTGSTNGFDEILALHSARNAVGNFHMSGTLMSAAEWYDPAFNQLLRDGITAGWVCMLTSAYAQHIMPFVTDNMNNWSVNVEHDMVNTLYNYNAHVAWIPERVWLAGGHYPDAGLSDSWLGDNWTQHEVNAVILDDWPHASGNNSHKIHWMNNGSGITLRVISIDGSFTGNVHYNPGAAIAQIQGTGRYQIIVYGTDWEAAAELADFNCPNCLENYSQVVNWVADNAPGVGSWKLDAALNNADFNGWGIEVGNGTYGLIGGTDGYGGTNNSWYTGWASTASLSDSHNPAWGYGQVWWETYQRLNTAPNNNLSESGWYIMMTNLHETGWHDYMGGPISGWEHRYSSHIKNAAVYAEAAHWAAGEYQIPVNAYLSDIDIDGTQELVIHNDRVMAVFESIGGRAPWIFARGPSGYNYSVVGSDNTYWAETDGDYDEPSSKNHQAAFADVSPTYRDNLYSMSVDQVTDSTARILLSYGEITKTIQVSLAQPYLDVRYDVGDQDCYIQQGFTPDLIDLIWNADMQRVWAPDVAYAGYRNPNTGATGVCMLNNGGASHNIELAGTLVKIEEVKGHDRFGYLLFAGETSAPDTQGRIPELEALKTLNLDHFGPRLNAQAAFISSSIIEVWFSEAVSLSSAQNPANWSLQGFSGSYSVVSAARQADWTRVRLTISPNLAGGDQGSIVVSNVVDLNGNVVLPAGNTASLFVPSGLTPHTIVIDGFNDFDRANECLYAGTDTLTITWDSLALYVGYWNRDLASANFFVNLDVNQQTGSGADSSSVGRVRFADPFKIEYQLYIDGGPNSIDLNRWTGTSWQIRHYGSHTASSYNGWSGNPFTEVRIPWSELGNPTGLALSVHVNNQNNLTTLRVFPPDNVIGNPTTITQIYRIYQPYISGSLPLMGARIKYILTGDLSSPDDVVITSTGINRHLSWTGISGAVSYVVSRADSTDGTYNAIGETSATSFDDSTAIIGTRVFYMVISKAGI